MADQKDPERNPSSIANHDVASGSGPQISESGHPSSSVNQLEGDTAEEHDSPGHAEIDSSYGDAEFDTNSITDTLASSVKRFREEHGRTYHSYGGERSTGLKAFASNRHLEISILMLRGSHHFWTLILEGKLFLAPVKSLQKVLDLGTGTGIWAMDVADQYPSAVVKGMDLSPIQPLWTAPNAVFEVDDYNHTAFDVSPNHDLIHARELLGSVLDWPRLLRKCFNGLTPGGWIECVEPDIKVTSNHMPLPADDPNAQWVEVFREVGQQTGMTFEAAVRLKDWLEKAGFENVEEVVFPIAVGSWPRDKKQKELGMWNQVRLANGMRDFTERRMRNSLGKQDVEIEALIARSRAAVQDSNLYTHQNMSVSLFSKAFTYNLT
ncbi:hypothetical protein BP5796_03699 [Coleophoma crateriformis]|uniref:S-adenosyl-L-methionine-dependent methyltransferase n=1 Tax=Coleophoma crateriformis TaxID=565419 RepID=A0A3D8SGU8_9HELO|nr:hypothetical protein BP5796_03699 [Coleophoma crateriformis]